MSKRISGVKNLVSNIGAFSRVLPFIQPISPTANGVCVSTSGPGSGAVSASGTTWGAAATSVGAVKRLVAAKAAAAGADGAGGAPFMTMSLRGALLGATVTAGKAISGKPSTSDVSDHAPGLKSANE